MSRGKLENWEIAELERNPYTVNVTEKYIKYSEEFIEKFIEEYRAGKRPTRIFMEAGFDPDILGSKRIERAAARWKERAGIKLNRRHFDTLEEKIQKRDMRIAELEAELETLRQMHHPSVSLG